MAFYFTSQILMILSFLREQGLIHRDLKPANLLLNEKYQLKLTDFGSAVKKARSDISSISACSKFSGVSHISNVSNTSNVSNISYISKDVTKEGEQDAESDLVGSECYVSPEMIESHKATFASDLWAFGVIIY